MVKRNKKKYLDFNNNISGHNKGSIL